jgi:hypothetical protein
MLLFVHQQIAIIQCSYKINSHERTLSGLKDAHKNLTFQLALYTSPTTLDTKLAAADINLVFPKEINVVKIPSVIATPLTLVDSSANPAREQFNLLNVLGFAKEAQAEILNESSIH